jgi:hypothetical protein
MTSSIVRTHSALTNMAVVAPRQHRGLASCSIRPVAGIPKSCRKSCGHDGPKLRENVAAWMKAGVLVCALAARPKTFLVAQNVVLGLMNQRPGFR